jgi:hypothetical protein
MAVARMVLTDFGGYCLRRKPRRGEDVTFVVDEFSAVTSAAPMVIDLAERVRDVNGQVVVSAQSYEGLGENPDERGRMLKALAPGGVIVHRLSDPDEIVKIAGTVRAVEQSWQLDQMGASGLATVKMHHKMRVDPDAVRQARTGEAWVLTQGRAVRMSVIRSRIPPELRDRAHGLVGQAWMQARGELEAGLPPEAQPWWEVPVLGPPPKPLEAGGLLELVAGTGDLPAGPTPPELSPGPTPPDPRVLLLIAAYVRAGQIARAHEIAKNTEGLPRPAEYVAELVQRRVKAVQEPKASGASPRRPRRRRR